MRLPLILLSICLVFSTPIAQAAPEVDLPAMAETKPDTNHTPPPDQDQPVPQQEPSLAELNAGLLYDMCSEDDATNQSLCHAYLAGQWETMQWLGLGHFSICPPKTGVSLELMRQLTMRWLENNHGMESAPRAEALIRAMRHYYECPR